MLGAYNLVMQIDKLIFKAYDVRGIFPEQLDEDAAYAIGRAFATLLKKENPHKEKVRLAVGGDMRVSTPDLKPRMIAGLLDSGIDVDDIGMVSTPTFYFAVSFYGYDGGVQTTASHNPAEWNGFKIVRTKAVPLSKDTGIMDLLKIIEEENFVPLAETPGVLGKRDGVVAEQVTEQLKEVEVQNIKKFKVVVDPANGMGGLEMKEMFSRLPSDVTWLNFEPDGNFPAHEADPMKPENVKELCDKVVELGADLGIAIDGDGDRTFFIDNKGQVIPQAIIRGVMATIEIKKKPGATVAYEIRPGKITNDLIEEAGGRYVLTPVGSSLIKAIMEKEGAVFGGESSGHYFYTLPYGTFEAPTVLVSKFLQYISEQNKPTSEIFDQYKRYFHSGEINIHMDSREQIQEKVELVKQKYSDGKVITIDGVSVEYPDFWFNLRASNTEPLLRLSLEARSEEVMKQKSEELKALLLDK